MPSARGSRPETPAGSRPCLRRWPRRSSATACSGIAARNSRCSPRPARGREPAVEVERRTDQREVGERLREVAEVLPTMAELLAVEPQVVRVAEHLLEEEARLLE